MSETYTVRQVGDVTIIDCTGRITLGGGAYGLRDQIGNLIKQGQKKVLLNLGGASYFDSTGIGELVSGFTKLANRGAQLKLLAMTPRVKDLLQITKLYTVFEVFEDEDEAVRSFGPKPDEESKFWRRIGTHFDGS